MKKKFRSSREQRDSLPRNEDSVFRDPVMLGLFAFGLVLFLLGARGDLWFDEVFSFQWARAAKAWWELLAVYRHDNNHFLNTAWLYFLGDGMPSLVYRIPSIVSGLFSLVLLSIIAKRLVPSSARGVVFLSVVSFPMILYFSEARGYGLLIAFSLGAFLLARGIFPGASLVRMVVFWGVCLAGGLSHATFLFVFAALAVWAVAQFLARRNRALSEVLRVALWFFPPAVALGSFYWFFVREMIVAGGPQYSVPKVLGHFFGFALGLPTEFPVGGISIVVGVALLVLGILALRKQEDQVWIFFLAVCLVPVFALLLTGTEFLYFRYFLVVLPFFYLLCGAVWECWIAKNVRGNVIGLVLLGAVFVGQAFHTVPLFVHGRGNYQEAIRWILLQSPTGGETTLISDQDLRTGMVVQFYRALVPRGERIRYLPQWESGPVTGEWLILDSQHPEQAAPGPVVELLGVTYLLQKSFRSGPVSGAHWYVYKKQ